MSDETRMREALDALCEALFHVDIQGEIGRVEDYDEALHNAREVLAATDPDKEDA